METTTNIDYTNARLDDLYVAHLQTNFLLTLVIVFIVAKFALTKITDIIKRLIFSGNRF